MTRPEGSGERILVVDDAEVVRRLVGAMLERSGYVVVEAYDGESALEVIQANGSGIDLVLTDLMMPRMGGRELALRLASLRPEVPVVFMSGYIDVPLPNRPDRRTEFLTKPFTAAALLGSIRRALDGTGLDGQ